CVEVDAPGGLPRVRTDAGALGQVVVNVVKNALDAVEGREGARVRVEAYPAAGGVGIRIEDNGRGIPPQDVPRIFEPFFTTKDPGRGTGLGLALSYAIMRDLRGEIEVRSDEGNGTLVTLSLPADAGRAGA
ncbi:MAG: ATP-binding protein, partial [Planctomycetes bacterium]|nr:ATP-binding protein [Planctomycetota bacterium]